MYFDPVFWSWVGLLPIVSAIVLGLIVRRRNYKDEVKRDIEWIKKRGRRIG